MILKTLEQVIISRKSADPGSSWTAQLLAAGPEKCAEKFGEESIEAVIEAVRGDQKALTSEAADVVYHLMVMLASRNIDFTDVLTELARRSDISGLDERAQR